jgi:hypothetical protein
VPFLKYSGKPGGFVVADMTAVDQFSAIESAVLRVAPLPAANSSDRDKYLIG